MSSYIDEHRERFGVEPISRTLEISASAYYQRAMGESSARSLEDERLLALIAEIHEAPTTAPTATGACGSPCDGLAASLLAHRLAHRLVQVPKNRLLERF